MLEIIYLISGVVLFATTLLFGLYIVPRRMQTRTVRWSLMAFFLALTYRAGNTVVQVLTNDQAVEALTWAGAIGIIMVAVFSAIALSAFSREQRLR